MVNNNMIITRVNLEQQAIVFSIAFTICAIIIPILVKNVFKTNNQMSLHMKMSALVSITMPSLLTFTQALITNNSLSYSIHKYADIIINDIYCQWFVSINICVLMSSRCFLKIFYLSEIEYSFQSTPFKLNNVTYYVSLILIFAFCGATAFVLIMLLPNITVQSPLDALYIKSCPLPAHMGWDLNQMLPYAILCNIWNDIAQLIFFYMYYWRCKQSKLINNKYICAKIYCRAIIFIIRCILWISFIVVVFLGLRPQIKLLLFARFPVHFLELITMVFSLVINNKIHPSINNNNNMLSVNIYKGYKPFYLPAVNTIFDVEVQYIQECNVIRNVLFHIVRIPLVYSKLIAEYASTQYVRCQGINCDKRLGFVECYKDFDWHYDTVSTVLDENDNIRYYIYTNVLAWSDSDIECQSNSHDDRINVLCIQCGEKSIWQCSSCFTRKLPDGTESTTYVECTDCKAILCEDCVAMITDDDSFCDSLHIMCEQCYEISLSSNNINAHQTGWDLKQFGFS